MMVSLRHAKVEEPFSFMVLEKKCIFFIWLFLFWTYLYSLKMKLSFFYGFSSIFYI